MHRTPGEDDEAMFDEALFDDDAVLDDEAMFDDAARGDAAVPGPGGPGGHRRGWSVDIARVGDFLAWLGGGDKAVLAKVSSERARFAQMAGVLLTTAGIAAASMMFALHDGVRAPWFWAVVLGFCWGVVILNLDRLLVLSMGSIRDRGRMLMMAVPRLALAALLAVVISTPLVLRIFASDIKLKVFEMQLERSKTQKALEASSKEQQLATALARQISAQKKILAGHLPTSVTTPQYQAAQASVNALQAQEKSAQQTANTALEAWQCELYGVGVTCHGASNRAGAGPLAYAKHQEYLQDLRALDAIKRQLAKAQIAEKKAAKVLGTEQAAILKQAQRAARAALPGLDRRYNQLEAMLAAQSRQGTQLNYGDSGLLTQIQALFEISGQNPALGFTHLAVFLLFFAVEMLPVTVKLLLNFGPMSAYEVVAKLREDEQIDSAQAQRAVARRIEEGKSRVRVTVEDDMRQREEDLGVHANEHVAAEMTMILDHALQEWSQRVRSRLSAAGPGGGGGGAGPGGGRGTRSGGGPGGGQPGNGASPPPGTVRVNSNFSMPDGSNL